MLCRDLPDAVDKFIMEFDPTKLEKALELSEKQTARLVAKHTGRSFKDELRYRKVVAAQTLADTSDMSMSEIADHVGYTSYSSLWKAMQKYKQ